jgi:hypothetical protein
MCFAKYRSGFFFFNSFVCYCVIVYCVLCVGKTGEA